ncbi:MAG: glycoside hydrolase family 15 protein [Proteobacteria bacterium]|nr:glycoside hydrolase family 15 protein [Pseudomonadota bacterium]
MSAPIESYGMIGDCRTAALVGKNGSVDWLCWPRFDSDACFAALLGGQSNGFWLITPNEAVRAVRRRYRPDTLILETEFETARGRITLIDFMLPDSPSSDLIRIVRGDAGEVPVCMELMLRFGYGATTPWVTRLEGGAMRAVAGPDMVVLRTPASFRGENFKTMAQFVLAEGQSIPFVLSYGPSHLPVPAPVDPYDSLQKCEKFWCDWTARTKTDGIHTEAIKRSLITLKALTFLPSGGIVAAPTTSLPERFGGVRNWDYRLCWLRDATLTLLAMMEADIYDEAAAWRDWLQRAVAGAPAEMQIMYGLRGERRLTEWIADWLPGYADSRPVRIGNAAHQQFQLDVYGELIDVFERSRRRGLAAAEEGWELQRSLVDHVTQVWRNPDNGIWETRGPQRHFVHSKVMAWVALDRGIKSVETHALEGPVKDWRAIRDDIRNEVLDRGFDKTRNTFRAAYDSDQLDASLLLLAHTGFIDADDPRFVGTVEAIERELLRDGFVMRHNMSEADEGLQPGEGAFLACSFWLADAYMSIGRHADAEALFLRLLAVRNDLGLLAEEYDPREGRLLGNFPQAFSHIALINTAFRLSRSREARPETAKPGSTESAAPAGLSRPASSSGSR